MREGFRPYVKLFTIAGSDTARKTVSLKDTGNDSITCNYIKVEPVSGTINDGIFYVAPTGVNSELDAIDYIGAASLPTDGTLSGNVGGVGSCLNGSVTLSLLSPDESFSVFLSHTSSADVVYAITYGVVKDSNSRKDNGLNPGD